MSKKNKQVTGMANPLKLAPRKDKDDDDVIQVVIETPKRSRNEFAFDPEQKAFQLKKVLPVGMAFPYEFGFVPSTKAEDGDPVDVLVLMDESAFPGCLVNGRVIGIIEAEQGEKKDMERNDRIVAIEKDNHTYSFINHIEDLGKEFVKELEAFFVN